VAHRSLRFGTLVEFRWKGRVLTVPVIDRGPYVQGRTWDLTAAACRALDHCFTGPIEWRIVND
jgi:rare lipoprotein A (peptidoglycan hydrolase)